MPLSEEELRLLEQMERALVQEDPKFASTLRGTSSSRTARHRAAMAFVLFLVGIAVLMGGAIMRITPLGIAGFVVMLGSATFGLTAWRARTAPAESQAIPGVDLGSHDQQAGRRLWQRGPDSFMDRLEDRWRRRRGDNDAP